MGYVNTWMGYHLSTLLVSLMALQLMSVGLYRSAVSIKLDADLELGSNKELRRLILSFYQSRPKVSRHLPA